MALYHATEDIINIDSIVSKLTHAENELRHRVMDAIIESQAPYEPSSEQEKSVLEHLQSLNVLDRANCVQAIYPLSAQPTSKRVELLGRKQCAYALCAVDALGFHWTFDEPLRIHARCEQTSLEFTLLVSDSGEVTAQGIDPCEIRVLTHNLKHSQTWSSCCCTIMHFFSSQKALESWVEAHACSCADYYWLTLEEAIRFARNLFSEKTS